MFCQHCGNQLPDDARFCNNCGAELNLPTVSKPSGEEAASVPATQSIKMDETVGTTLSSTEKNRRKPMYMESISKKQIAGLITFLGIIILAFAIIFGIRSTNISNAKANLPPIVYDAVHDEIVNHYLPLIPGWTKSIECHYVEDFKVENSSTGLTFVGSIIVNAPDGSQYKPMIIGYADTNWMKTEITNMDWNIIYDDPAFSPSNDEPDYFNTENNYSDEPEYGDYGELTDNSPNLPVNLSEPFGYYEKADGLGGFAIEYISDDDSVMIEYYSDGQPGYYGGQWFEADFHMSCDHIDFSSDNVLDFIDSNGNSVFRLDAYESYITITASQPLYGVSIDRMNGNYYCKMQSSFQ